MELSTWWEFELVALALVVGGYGLQTGMLFMDDIRSVGTKSLTSKRQLVLKLEYVGAAIAFALCSMWVMNAVWVVAHRIDTVDRMLCPIILFGATVLPIPLVLVALVLLQFRSMATVSPVSPMSSSQLSRMSTQSDARSSQVCEAMSQSLSWLSVFGASALVSAALLYVFFVSLAASCLDGVSLTYDASYILGTVAYAFVVGFIWVSGTHMLPSRRARDIVVPFTLPLLVFSLFLLGTASVTYTTNAASSLDVKVCFVPKATVNAYRTACIILAFSLLVNAALRVTLHLVQLYDRAIVDRRLRTFLEVSRVLPGIEKGGSHIYNNNVQEKRVALSHPTDSSLTNSVMSNPASPSTHTPPFNSEISNQPSPQIWTSTPVLTPHVAAPKRLSQTVHQDKDLVDVCSSSSDSSAQSCSDPPQPRSGSDAGSHSSASSKDLIDRVTKASDPNTSSHPPSLPRKLRPSNRSGDKAMAVKFAPKAKTRTIPSQWPPGRLDPTLDHKPPRRSDLSGSTADPLFKSASTTTSSVSVSSSSPKHVELNHHNLSPHVSVHPPRLHPETKEVPTGHYTRGAPP